MNPNEIQRRPTKFLRKLCKQKDYWLGAERGRDVQNDKRLQDLQSFAKRKQTE